MINVTSNAQAAIKKQLIKRNKGLGITIGVKKTGCSGFAYVVEFLDTEPNQEYTSFTYTDFILAIDNKSLPILDNITVDYVRKGLNEGFDFINPKESARCGCGERFRI